MQRLIWVKKRFWFALALVGLAFAGHWYGAAHPPQRAAHSALPPAMLEMATDGATPGKGDTEFALETADSESSGDEPGASSSR
jgi:hypothetical protein